MRKFLPVILGVAVLVAGVLFNVLYRPVPTAPAPAQSAPSEVETATAVVAKPPAATFAPVFEPCAHCHQIGEGARNATGPVLNGIVGKPSASTDYPYSEAMLHAGLVWDEETLRAFLLSPGDVVPDSRMYFGGLPESDVDAVIEFLKNPQP